MVKVTQLDELKQHRKGLVRLFQIPSQPQVGGPFIVGSCAVARHFHGWLFLFLFFCIQKEEDCSCRRNSHRPELTSTRIRFMLH